MTQDLDARCVCGHARDRHWPIVGGCTLCSCKRFASVERRRPLTIVVDLPPDFVPDGPPIIHVNESDKARTLFSGAVMGFVRRGQAAQEAVDALGAGKRPYTAPTITDHEPGCHCGVCIATRQLAGFEALMAEEKRGLPEREVAQRALQLLELRPPMRTCNVCGHQTDRGAGKDGNLCPLLACPGDLQ